MENKHDYVCILQYNNRWFQMPPGGTMQGIGKNIRRYYKKSEVFYDSLCEALRALVSPEIKSEDEILGVMDSRHLGYVRAITVDREALCNMHKTDEISMYGQCETNA